MRSKKKGLNGFFGSLWNAFKEVFGGENNDQSSAVGSMIGRKIAKYFTSMITVFTGGFLKTAEYVPTGLELLLLNKLKTALNNYMISLVNGIDSFFNANDSTELRIGYLNNAIRKVQLIHYYFLNNSHPTLSKIAQDYLAEQIQIMVQTFELTIEELLNENAIVYVKTEGVLAVNSSDAYPDGILIKTANSGYGFQYKVENAANSELTTDLPSSTGNINLTPNQATVVTDEVAGLTTTKKGSLLVPVLLFLAAVGLALIPSNKSEKGK